MDVISDIANMSLYKAASDLKNPKPYPGKLNRKNKTGTLMSKYDWLVAEARLWLGAVQEQPVYDESTQKEKVTRLRKWLARTFKISHSESKEILVEIEFNENTDDQNTEIVDAMEIDQPAEQERQEEVDMFELSDDDITDQVEDTEKMNTILEINMMVGNADDLTTHEKESFMVEFKKKRIEELLANEISLPKFVTRSLWYQKRKREFIDLKFDEEYSQQSSQDLLNAQSQLPSFITQSSRFKERLAHLSETQKSNMRMIKNAKETIEHLKKSKSATAYQQIKIITAALYDPRYGCPDLDVSVTVKKSAKLAKAALFSGKKCDLNPEQKKQKQIFPYSVKDLAEDCWRTRATRTDPSKHHRPSTTKKDNAGETVPTIYQTMTDEEAYQIFQENYKESVKQKMLEMCTNLRTNLSKRKESATKEKKLRVVQRKEGLFPGLVWFIAQKPPETKLMGIFIHLNFIFSNIFLF